MDRTLLLSAAGLVTAFLFFEFTAADLRVQDRLYDFSAHAWLINEKAALPRMLFYTWPKLVIIALGVIAVGFALGPAAWRLGAGFSTRRRDWWVVVATLAAAPALIAAGKATTNVHCPKEIRRYGGEVAYARVLERYPENDQPVRRGRGFPAGHASGGFALMSLAGLAATSRGRWIGAGIGLGAGALMGVYQMVKGAHYLSHTVVTAWVCWIVFLLWRRLLRASEAAT
ncbi:MAG: phosphatase PAP2 family protein [Rariglobus sp.]